MEDEENVHLCICNTLLVACLSYLSIHLQHYHSHQFPSVSAPVYYVKLVYIKYKITETLVLKKLEKRKRSNERNSQQKEGSLIVI